VITASTGNYGQSVAFAARLFGVRAVAAMPNAPTCKVEAIRNLRNPPWAATSTIAAPTRDMPRSEDALSLVGRRAAAIAAPRRTREIETLPEVTPPKCPWAVKRASACGARRSTCAFR
jgi:hypothetical protein